MMLSGKGGGQQDGEQVEEEQQVFGVKKKTKKAAQPLCRPIIAVCNDMYAPALRPLRGVAKIVQFKKPSVSLSTLNSSAGGFARS